MASFGAVPPSHKWKREDSSCKEKKKEKILLKHKTQRRTI